MASAGVSATLSNLTTASNHFVYAAIPNTFRAIFLTLSILGFSLNILTVAVILLHKPMRQSLTNAFIVKQSLIDATASVFMFFTIIYQNNLVTRKPGNLADEALCRIWFARAPMYGMFVSSIYSIVALTFERFLAVIHPLRHKAHFRKKKVAAIFLAVWFVGILYYATISILTSGIDTQGSCKVYYYFPIPVTQQLWAIVDLFVLYLIPLACLLFFYYKMVTTLRGLAARRENGESTAQPPRNETPSDVRAMANLNNDHASSELALQQDQRISVVNLSDGTGHQAPSRDLLFAIHTPAEYRPRFVELIQGDRAISAWGQAAMEVASDVAPKESTTALKAKSNIVKTLIVVGVAFVSCFTCNRFYFTMCHLGYPYCNFTSNFFNFTVVMEYGVCCVNPVIYCLQYRQFQRALRALLWRPRGAASRRKITPIVR